MKMQIGKWGNSLAVRLPRVVVLKHNLKEGDEISERVVIQELGLEALRTVNHLSTIGGLLGSVFTFDRVTERRRQARRWLRGAVAMQASGNRDRRRG